MEILLVRHGQTRGNVAHRHQPENTPLSKMGNEQAKKVAELINKRKPTHLVTSNLVRAVETARIVGEVCNLVPDTNHHIIELPRPSHLYGRHHSSLHSIIFYIQWYLGKSSDGESYKDLRKRIQVAQESLLKYPEDACLVVVSHAVFISFFIAHLCSNKMLSPLGAAFAFSRILSMPNTAVTSIKVDHQAEEERCGWSVNN